MIYKCKACDRVFGVAEYTEADDSPSQTTCDIYIQPPSFAERKAEASVGICPPCALANIMALARVGLVGIEKPDTVEIILRKGYLK